MTERPRPQYGEYATPEVQAKAMGLPPVTPTVADESPASVSAPVATVPDSLPMKPVAARGGVVNRVVTVVLLALGLANVLTGVATYLSLPTLLQSAYDQLGAGEYTATSLASALGIVAIVVSATVWAVTAWICFRLLRRGRIAWWVPLLGAVTTVIALAVIMTVAVVSDPGFAAFTTSLS